MPVFRSLFVFLVCSSVCLAQQELRTLSGKSIKGTVLSISNKEVVVKEGEKEIKTPLSEVLAIDFRTAGKPSPDAKFTLLRLLDDSILHCSSVSFKGNQLTVNLISGQSATVPLGSVVYLIRDAANPALKPKWDAVLATKIKRDRVVILKDGELNPIEGTLGDIDAAGKNIQFRLEGNIVQPVLLDRLAGMVFHRTEVLPESPVCMVEDVAGNVIAATAVTLQGGNYLIATPTGAKITFAEPSLARLDYNMGKLTFLSDMEPKVKFHGSHLFGFSFGSDQAGKNTVRLGDTIYSKSITLRGNMDVEYHLGGKYKSFKAMLGKNLSDEDRGDGQATVTIYCDGNQVFSATVDTRNPRPVALNVRDVQTLRITIRSRDSALGFLGARATLAEARVSQ